MVDEAGQYTVTITDANGNMVGTCSFIVTVNDCEAPTITCSDLLNIECGTEDVAAWIAGIEATASDICDPEITVESMLLTDISSCGNTIEQVYLFSAKDAAGNVTTCTATYESDDTTDPIISDAQDLTLYCNGTGQSAALTAWLSLFEDFDFYSNWFFLMIRFV